MSTDPREPLGRLVHETRLAHEAEQAAAEGRARFHLGLWEDRSDAQRELDMRIGQAVTAADRARLAEVRAVLLERGQSHGAARRRAIAMLGIRAVPMLGFEEEGHDGG